MINNYFDYQKEYYSQMKNQEEDVYIVRFSPKEVELSNGEILIAGPNNEFDQGILEDILDYNRRTRSE